MGQRITVHHFDDLNPDDEAQVTVPFAWDGTAYEIDVTRERAAELGRLLAPYVSVARETGKAPQRRKVGEEAPPRSGGQRRATRAPAQRADTGGAYTAAKRARAEWRARVLAWADRQPGVSAGKKGVLGAEAVAAYVAAHPHDPEVPSPGVTAEEARARGVID